MRGGGGAQDGGVGGEVKQNNNNNVDQKGYQTEVINNGGYHKKYFKKNLIVAYVHMEYSTYQFPEESKGGGIPPPPPPVPCGTEKKRGPERVKQMQYRFAVNFGTLSINNRCPNMSRRRFRCK